MTGRVVSPPQRPAGLRRSPQRRRRMPPVLVARNSIDAGAHIANRFAKLRDLPEHYLFMQIHGRLAMGEPPYAVAKWVQATVPTEDPYSPASMPLMTLNSRLCRYADLLPPAAKVPRSRLDELTKGLMIEIDVLAKLASVIVYQEQRISQFAEAEKTFPLGMTSEQQRKEVVTYVDMLMKMRDTQIAFGMVPGTLAPHVNGRCPNCGVGGDDDDRLGADPFTRFLLDNPQAIPHLMSGLDRAVSEAVTDERCADGRR